MRGYLGGMLLILDNYDSFTYNLVQRVGELYVRRGMDVPDIRVVRNDKLTVAEAVAMKPDRVIVSPGPCTPREAGVSVELIRALAGRVPLLGVCLGHQSIGACFGMTVDRHTKLMHGKTSLIHHDGSDLFVGLSNPFVATRYHSLVILADSFDDERFAVTAWSYENENEDEDQDARGGVREDAPGGERVIMALQARPGVFGSGRDAPLLGVQFHPESFMTHEGPRLLANFLGLPPHEGDLSADATLPAA